MSYEPENDLIENYRARAAQIGWDALADITTHAGDALTADWMRKQKAVKGEVTETAGNLSTDEPVARRAEAEARSVEQAAQTRAEAKLEDDSTPKGRRAPGKSTTAG